MKSYFIYILKCSDGSYYTGVTNNIQKRFFEHQEGLIKGSYTHDRRPTELVHVEEFQDINDALSREKQIKKWSRKKKEALISEDFDKLITLSKCHPSTGSG
jgi:putative endonuclease